MGRRGRLRRVRRRRRRRPRRQGADRMTGGEKRLMMPPPEQRGAHVSLYWIIVGTVVIFGSPLVSILAAVQIADRNAEHVIAEQKRVEAASIAEAKRVACDFFSVNLDVYETTPPSTDTGRNLRQAYLEFYQMSGCQPTRK